MEFSDIIQVIVEPEHLRLALQEARTSDLTQRIADRARAERLLGPILTNAHRESIFKKLYSEGL